MKLLLKFNLVFILIFLAGLAATGYISWQLLQRNAREEIAQNARLLMDMSLAMRTYTSSQVNPLLDTQMKYTFLPQSVPAYSATEVFNGVRKAFPQYDYKEATINPTNPRNRASDWEADIVKQFRTAGDRTELVGERDTPAGRAFYIARPIEIKAQSCLSCHSTVAAAPRTLVDLYGPANGFGWKLNETVGAQIASVPLAVTTRQADELLKLYIGGLVAVFAVIAILLNVMLHYIIVKPVRQISAAANDISMGNMNAPEVEARGSDEIASLTESFNRMRRSLASAMGLLGST